MNKLDIKSGFFKEVECIVKCYFTEYYDLVSKSCQLCSDINCVVCGYPYTYKLTSWIGTSFTGTCAVCDQFSQRYGPGISLVDSNGSIKVDSVDSEKLVLVTKYCFHNKPNILGEQFFARRPAQNARTGNLFKFKNLNSKKCIRHTLPRRPR